MKCILPPLTLSATGSHVSGLWALSTEHTCTPKNSFPQYLHVEGKGKTPYVLLSVQGPTSSPLQFLLGFTSSCSRAGLVSFFQGLQSCVYLPQWDLSPAWDSLQCIGSLGAAALGWACCNHLTKPPPSSLTASAGGELYVECHRIRVARNSKQEQAALHRT